jgi:DNA replication protein DnaC
MALSFDPESPKGNRQGVRHTPETSTGGLRMVHQTVEKLYHMRLDTMAAAFNEQLEHPSTGSLSFEDRFAMIVDREWISRENRKLTKRLKAARLRLKATVEDIDYRHPRGLDKSVMRSLITGQWIKSHQNVIITGPTGIGKSYISEALADKACRDGFTAVRYRATRLMRELEIARGDGSYINLLNRMAKIDLLVLDDWMMEPLTDTERRDFLEIMEDRHDLKSTVITSQYPVTKWHERIGEPTTADAILDRIVHNAHRIPLKGESMRKTRSSLTPSEH